MCESCFHVAGKARTFPIGCQSRHLIGALSDCANMYTCGLQARAVERLPADMVSMEKPTIAAAADFDHLHHARTRKARQGKASKQATNTAYATAGQLSTHTAQHMTTTGSLRIMHPHLMLAMRFLLVHMEDMGKP